MSPTSAADHPSGRPSASTAVLVAKVRTKRQDTRRRTNVFRKITSNLQCGESCAARCTRHAVNKRRCASARQASAERTREDDVREAGDEEADEPRVVVERLEGGDEETG